MYNKIIITLASTLLLASLIGAGITAGMIGMSYARDNTPRVGVVPSRACSKEVRI